MPPQRYTPAPPLHLSSASLIICRSVRCCLQIAAALEKEKAEKAEMKKRLAALEAAAAAAGEKPAASGVSSLCNMFNKDTLISTAEAIAGGMPSSAVPQQPA